MVIPGDFMGVRTHAPKTSAVANWWEVAGVTCVCAYAPKGAASLAASYVNLANPGTYDAAPGTAPTFATATGWTFAAASQQYLDTGVAPEGDWSMLIRFASVTVGLLSGTYGGTYCYLAPALAGSVYYGLGNQELGVAPALATGVLGLAARRGYRDGAYDGVAAAAVGGTYTQAFHVGCGRHHLSVQRNFYATGSILAYVLYDSTLDDTQMETVSAAMAAL